MSAGADFALDADELETCVVCARHWTDCRCSPEPAHAAARLLRSGVSIADAFEAEELSGAA